MQNPRCGYIPVTYLSALFTRVQNPGGDPTRQAEKWKQNAVKRVSIPFNKFQSQHAFTGRPCWVVPYCSILAPDGHTQRKEWAVADLVTMTSVTCFRFQIGEYSDKGEGMGGGQADTTIQDEGCGFVWHVLHNRHNRKTVAFTLMIEETGRLCMQSVLLSLSSLTTRRMDDQ